MTKAKTSAVAKPKTKTLPAPKKSAKPSKKSAKKSAKKAAKIPTLLTSEQRRKVLKPREGYEELLEQVARTWENAKSLRVPGLSVARLRKLLRDAERSAEKESAMRDKLERALRPLYDARLLAEEKAWRAVLDVNAAVKLFARSDPSLLDTFAFLVDALTSNPGGGRSAVEADAVKQDLG